MKVIKSHTYNIINPEPFEIPFPLVFELLSGNTLLAEYTISETGVVDYSFNPNTSEKILTSIRRPLTLDDIYFLFTSRIFPDKTPYTAVEMERFGITEYHPYTIVRKTRGMSLVDKYWLRFENEEINYKSALYEFNDYYENSYKKYLESLEAPNVGSDTSGVPQKEGDCPVHAAAVESAKGLVRDEQKMSDDMVSALMASLGDEAEDPGGRMIEPDSGELEKMSDEDIAAMLAMNAPHEEAESSGGMMSPEAIAAMLAANSAPEPVTEAVVEPAAEESKPEPAAESDSGGGMMSPEAIAALLAANQ